LLTLSALDSNHAQHGWQQCRRHERYADGSFRSELVASTDKHRREDVLSVRFIEYAIDDPHRPGATDPKYRLITTILDPEQAPADELAARYAQRWEIESIFDELKTHQRGPRVILRSRTPEGVYQEAWGYLCVHYALRALIHGAAHDHDHDPDPDRISFTAALHAARRSIRTGLSQTVNLASALRRATSDSCTGCSRSGGNGPTPASSAGR